MKKQDLMIYKTEDGKADVALYAHDGNIWLNQNQLAERFSTSMQNVSSHVINRLKKTAGRFSKFQGGGGFSPRRATLDIFGSMRIFRFNNTCQAYVLGYAQIGGLLFFRGTR